MSQRGIELCYSVEKDEVDLYGSDLELEEVESVIWAAQVIDGLGLAFRGRIPAGVMGQPCHL
jgi:hypothetical protein